MFNTNDSRQLFNESTSLSLQWMGQLDNSLYFTVVNMGGKSPTWERNLIPSFEATKLDVSYTSFKIV